MKPNRGFSLVEMMVAMTLSLVVIGALLGMFTGTRTANRSTLGIASLTDGGRFAIDLISASARNAGFYACNNVSRQTTILNPGATPLPFAFAQAVGGYEAANTGTAGSVTVATPPVAGDMSAADWTGGLDGLLIGLPVKGSDVLVINSGVPGTLPVYVTAIADAAATFTVNAPGPLAAKQLAAISDCAKTVTFEITAIGGTTVTHNFGGAYPGNSAAAFPAGISFSPGAQVMPIATTVYYIGKGTDGDGALFRYDQNLNVAGGFTATELVEDVENLQVLYGYDSTGLLGVTQWLTADLVPNWAQVMSVKIAVLAASPVNSTTPPTAARTFNLLGTTVTAPLDSRLRQVFDTTITLRNAVP